MPSILSVLLLPALLAGTCLLMAAIAIGRLFIDAAPDHSRVRVRSVLHSRPSLGTRMTEYTLLAGFIILVALSAYTLFHP